jgi:hypothetical protein
MMRLNGVRSSCQVDFYILKEIPFIKMKTFSSVILVAFIMFSLNSCTKYVFVNKSYDPEIVPGIKPVRIVFVNLFDYTSQGYVKEKNEIPYYMGVKRFYEGLSASFSKDNSFIFFTGDTLKKDIPKGQLTAYLPNDSVLAICRRYDADMLLTIDSVNIFIDWTYTVQDDGNSKYKEKQYYLHTNFYVSFYSAAGEQRNRSMVEKSLLYKSRQAVLIIVTFKPSITNAIESIEPLSFEAGEEYVSKFYPKKVQETRKLYAGKVFKESNLFIELRNWEKAKELLDQLVESSDRDIARKARQNLLIVKELSELDR